MLSPFIMMNWNIVVLSSCCCHMISHAKTQTKEFYRYTHQLTSAQNRLNNKRLITICDRAHMVFLAWWTALFQPTGFFFNNITTAVINVQFVTIPGSLMSSLYTSRLVNWIRNIFWEVRQEPPPNSGLPSGMLTLQLLPHPQVVQPEMEQFLAWGEGNLRQVCGPLHTGPPEKRGEPYRTKETMWQHKTVQHSVV